MDEGWDRYKSKETYLVKLHLGCLFQELYVLALQVFLMKKKKNHTYIIDIYKSTCPFPFSELAFLTAEEEKKKKKKEKNPKRLILQVAFLSTKQELKLEML